MQLNSDEWAVIESAIKASPSPTSELKELMSRKRKEWSLYPAAYIVTPPRGEPYLVFAGSTAHDNAALFKYEMRPLYE